MRKCPFPPSFPDMRKRHQLNKKADFELIQKTDHVSWLPYSTYLYLDFYSREVRCWPDIKFPIIFAKSSHMHTSYWKLYSRYLLARRHLVNERNREELDEVSNKRLTSMAYDIAKVYINVCMYYITLNHILYDIFVNYIINCRLYYS